MIAMYMPMDNKTLCMRSVEFIDSVMEIESHLLYLAQSSSLCQTLEYIRNRANSLLTFFHVIIIMAHEFAISGVMYKSYVSNI